MKNVVSDKDDLPHICSYKAKKCKYFITTNRKLTQDKIKEMVNFYNPKDFLEKVLHQKGIETEAGY
jgi:hypothetical protein